MQLARESRSLFPVSRFVLGLLVLLAVSARLAAEEPADRILAKVNGQPVSAAQSQFFLAQLPADATSDETKQLTERLIERELIRQYLHKRKVVADPRVLEHQVAMLKHVITAKGEDVDQVLSRLKLTDQSLRDYLSLSIAWDQYVRSVVTEQQIRQAWDADRRELDGTRVRVAEIQRVIPRKASQADIDREIDLLQEIRKKLNSGELTFAAAAKQSSQGPTKDNGGELGEIDLTLLREPAARKAILSLQPGDISEPVRTATGVCLIQLHSITPGDLSPEDARPQILSRLSDHLWKEQVERERQQARIELLPK
ncbi:peptidylprolyl isomerase [Planctomicrobium sp. SH664]|uniref:peptidylprolyl isomerase n=1 Tax=Planctomicrobium sp. SH664 TaxID=3448125 RepID=UPI003F5B563D